jgi:hypothetical protein
MNTEYMVASDCRMTAARVGVAAGAGAHQSCSPPSLPPQNSLFLDMQSLFFFFFERTESLVAREGKKN